MQMLDYKHSRLAYKHKSADSTAEALLEFKNEKIIFLICMLNNWMCVEIFNYKIKFGCYL